MKDMLWKINSILNDKTANLEQTLFSKVFSTNNIFKSKFKHYVKYASYF